MEKVDCSVEMACSPECRQAVQCHLYIHMHNNLLLCLSLHASPDAPTCVITAHMETSNGQKHCCVEEA
jgi:hypothetical protein